MWESSLELEHEARERKKGVLKREVKGARERREKRRREAARAAARAAREARKP
jgi:hypothetical protein